MPHGWRLMWLLVFYDLPVIEPGERKAATKFHDFLLDEGFNRLHYSIYMRFCGSLESLESCERRIEHHLPTKGSVMALRLTDRQMAGLKRWDRGKADLPIEPPSQYRLF